MKTNEIAHILLNRRQATNPIVFQGDMINTLGYDGLREALNQRWLVPVIETGHLQVSTDMCKVEEMRKSAEAFKPEEANAPAAASTWDRPWQKPVGESRASVMTHAVRIHELLSPGTGHDSGSAMPTPTAPASAPQAPRPMSPTSPANAQAPAVNSDVSVVENGKTFTGKVKEVGQDGTYTLSFGSDKPAQDKKYKAEELSMVAAQ